MIHDVTDESFDAEVANSAMPCVILFSAGWCTYCDELAPVLENLSQKFGGDVKFCRVNMDAERGLRIKFAVAALPYIVYVANGQRTPLFDAIVTEARLEERIKYMLADNEAPGTMPL